MQSGKVGSVTLSVGDGDDEFVLLDRLPASISLRSTVQADLGIPIRTSLRWALETLTLSFDRDRFTAYHNLFNALRTALDRPVPHAEEKKEDAAPPPRSSSTPKLSRKMVREMRGSEEVALVMSVDRWHVMIKGEGGFAVGVKGEGLEFSGSPPRPIEQEGKTVDVSRLGARARSFNLYAITPDKDSGGCRDFCCLFLFLSHSPPPPPLQDCCLVTSKKEGQEEHPEGFIGLETHSTRVSPEEPPETSLRFWLNSLHVLLDKPVWDRVYALFDLSEEVGPLDLSQLPEKAKAAKEKAQSKMDFSLRDLYRSSDANVELTDLSLTFPPDAQLEEEFRGHTLNVATKRMVLKNTPGWTAVPHISDGVAMLPSAFAHHKVPEGTPASKWQFGIEGLEMVLSAGDGSEPRKIAEPADAMLYGRIFDCKPPHVEVAVRTSFLVR